jgi:hypothetical protein
LSAPPSNPISLPISPAELVSAEQDSDEEEEDYAYEKKKKKSGAGWLALHLLAGCAVCQHRSV